jgi:type II secretion system protein F
VASFSYRATTLDGKVVEGFMEAAAEAQVVTSLRNQGYIPLAVERGQVQLGKKRGFALRIPEWRPGRRVRNRDLMVFTRELATLLRAGMPLDRSLQSLSTLSENAVLQQTVGTVLGQVQAGKSLSEALGQHRAVFPSLFVNMIRAGEAGGVLETVLERLAEYFESSEKAREEVKSAMTYPLMLMITGGASILILLTYVLPKFTTVFADLGAAMPPSTKMIMSISDGLRAYWWVLVLFVGGIWYGFKRYTSTPDGRGKYDRWKLGVPLFGDVATKIQVSTFARTLGTMLKSGVPLLQSLDIVRAIVSNSVVAKALDAVAKDVSEGKGLAGPLERSGVFPPMALQMITVGEETGRLDDMLLVVAEHYDRDVGNAIARLMSMLGPLLLVVMGIATAFIVIAMLTAVFSVNEMAF